MNSFAKLGVAAALAVIAALVGFNYLTAPSVTGPRLGDDPTATPEPTATATPVGLLPEGPHVLTAGDAPEGQPSLSVTVNIPAPNWYGDPAGGFVLKNNKAEAPDGAGLIVFFGDLYVYGDPCQWSTTRPDTPATTVDELVAALAAQASRDASEPVDITVDGYSGKSITLRVPEDAVFGECDRGTFGSWGVPGGDPSPYRYHQDPGQIDEVWVVDVDGVLAVIDFSHYEGTPAEHVAELRAIVESITFGGP